MRVWLSHSSSHSSNWLEVAQFPNEEIANRVATEVEKWLGEVSDRNEEWWNGEDLHVHSDGNDVVVSFYADGGFDPLVDFLKEKGASKVSEEADSERVTLTITKPTWKEVDAVIVVLNLFRARLFDPDSYTLAKVDRTESKGKKGQRATCVHTLKVYTQDYDHDEQRFRGEEISDLNKLGVQVESDDY
jgi:hypothetical protein